jgi:hypothetical protein
MRDSGALSQQEYALLTSELLGGRPVPEAADRASETRGTRS